MQSKQKRRIESRRGAALWMCVLLLPVLLIIALMAINVSYMSLCRTELQVATDAASRAGGRTLAVTGDQDQAKTVARDAAGRNLVAGSPLQLDDTDFVFGFSERSALSERYDFDPNASATPNALLVRGRRTGDSSNGPIGLFAPSLMSVGQFSPTTESRSTQIEMDICIVVDISGSMIFTEDEVAGAVFPPASAPNYFDGAPAPPSSRWMSVIAAVNAFLAEMQQTPQLEQVGLVTYSDTGTIELPVQNDYQAVRDQLDNHTQAFSLGGTNIGDGLTKGVDAIGAARPWATKVVILLTDGIHNTGQNPISAANNARSNNVLVYTVTFSQEADQREMKKVAQRGGGEHTHAESGVELVQAFRDIANQLPTLMTK